MYNDSVVAEVSDCAPLADPGMTAEDSEEENSEKEGISKDKDSKEEEEHNKEELEVNAPVASPERAGTIEKVKTFETVWPSVCTAMRVCNTNLLCPLAPHTHQTRPCMQRDETVVETIRIVFPSMPSSSINPHCVQLLIAGGAPRQGH